MTAERTIDYDALTQDALRGVVRAILTKVAKDGLPGEHHFYVAFDTQAPGVSLSRRLKEKYPEEMMIVLQHRFWDLIVADEQFEVKLTFDGIPERLVVPFAALRVFFDPSVRFTLQFGEAGDDQPDSGGVRRRRRDSSNGNAEDGAGQRAARPRPRTKPRGAGIGEAPPAEAQPAPVQRAQPSLVARGGETVAKPGPVAVPKLAPPAISSVDSAPTGDSVAVGAAPDASPASVPGAKVFSLDQFRKK